MEGVLLLLLLFGGCTAALTSHIVSPIVVVILLVSATLRRKATPFFRIGIITGLMLLGSYSVTSNSSPPLFSFITYHSTGEVEGFREYSVLATLSFIIMGIQIGFILPSKPAITKSWLDVVGHSVFWNFSVGYLVLGIMNCFSRLFEESPRGDLFAAIWITTLFYIFGLFLIPALATGLTKLCLAYYQRRLKTKPP